MMLCLKITGMYALQERGQRKRSSCGWGKNVSPITLLRWPGNSEVIYVFQTERRQKEHLNNLSFIFYTLCIVLKVEISTNSFKVLRSAKRYQNQISIDYFLNIKTYSAFRWEKL